MAFVINQYYRYNICLALTLVLGACWGSLVATAARSLQEVDMYEAYENWMARYGRVYKEVDDKDRRFKIFMDNVARIESFNRQAAIHKSNYKLSVNEFADLTEEEFRASRNRFKPHVCSSQTTSSFKYENVTAAPSSIDWRKKGAVTPIKNQGQCGI